MTNTVYATFYSPGQRRQNADGQWVPCEILSLSTCKTANRENTVVESAEEAKKLALEKEAIAINFGLFGMPRHPVKMDHPKIDAYLRKYFRIERKG